MRRHVIFLAAAAALFAGSCGGTGSSTPPARTAPQARPARAPKLVVVLVLDQFASWVMSRHLPRLDREGFLRQAVEGGALAHVDYPYSGTYTAAGHASIATGAPPSEHGLAANKVLRDGREVDSVDDGEHEVLGVPGKYASPTVVQVESIGDALHEATGGEARVAALSFKDRGAVLTGGLQPDLVLFYEKSIPGFTSSRYYEPDGELPEWVQRWLSEHPPDEMLGVWEPLDRARYQAALGDDDRSGEGGFGLNAAFPHDARETEAPYATLRFTGLTNEYLLGLAAETVAELGMGDDDVPDLLFVSVSSTDYVGHLFGPESWEYLDNLIRLDRSLQRFASTLEAQTDVSFLLTADHGVAPLVERSQEDGVDAHRLIEAELIRAVDERLDEAYGGGDWVVDYAAPFIYLTDAALEHDDASLLAADALTALDGVYAAFESARAVEMRGSQDPILQAAALSVEPNPRGHVAVVPAENWVPELTDLDGTGTSHGTPWTYDRRVPVVMIGPNVSARVSLDEPADQRRVATTIAALLGVRPPAEAPSEPLPGLIRGPARSDP